MSPSLMTAGVLGLACGFLLWRLMAAHRKIGKLKAENAGHDRTIKILAANSSLSKDRIRDLTGLDVDRLRIDEDGGIWAQ